jgi:hypothetical protein
LKTKDTKDVTGGTDIKRSIISNARATIILPQCPELKRPVFFNGRRW